MLGVYCVLTAFLVANSQIAADSGQELQVYHYDVMTAGNGVNSLPNHFLRNSRDGHNDLGNEERYVSSVLASMINEAVEKLPRVAKIIKKNAGAAKAGKRKPRASRSVKKLIAAEVPRKTPLRPTIVEKMPHAAEAIEKMENSKEFQELEVAAKGADEALQKHWNPSGKAVGVGDASRDISGNEILSLKKWKVDFNGMRSMDVSPKHAGKIDRVHAAFAKLCDGDVEPTRAETSYFWSMLNWRDAPNSKRNHRVDLVRQAQRYVLLGLREFKKDTLFWEEWHALPKFVKFAVLDYLLNLHYQRLVRMYNIFRRNQPDKKAAILNLDVNPAGNAGTSNAVALHELLNVHSSYPSGPLNAASTPKGRRSKRSRRTYEGNIATTSLPSKQSRMQSPMPELPLRTATTTSGDHSVSTKWSPEIVVSNKPSSGESKVQSLEALAPPSTALTPKDVDTELSLGGIYDKSTFRTPSVPEKPLS